MHVTLSPKIKQNQYERSFFCIAYCNLIITITTEALTKILYYLLDYKLRSKSGVTITNNSIALISIDWVVQNSLHFSSPVAILRV
jgi:hypothetical protein